MAYKDKDKQKEAVREATRRYRQRKASVIPCDTRLNVIPSDTPDVILCEGEAVIPVGSDIPVKPSQMLTKERQVSKQGFNPAVDTVKITGHLRKQGLVED